MVDNWSSLAFTDFSVVSEPIDDNFFSVVFVEDITVEKCFPESFSLEYQYITNITTEMITIIITANTMKTIIPIIGREFSNTMVESIVLSLETSVVYVIIVVVFVELSVNSVVSVVLIISVNPLQSMYCLNWCSVLHYNQESISRIGKSF